MTEDSFDPQLELIDYRGFRLSVRKTPLDWLVFIALAGGQPVIVAGHDRDSAVALATAWVDENVPSDGSAETKSRG